MVKIRTFFERFYEYEQRLLSWAKQSKFWQFLGRWGKLIIGIQFAILFIDRRNAVVERDAYRKSNEVLVSQRVSANGFFRSKEATWWRKRMMLGVEGDTVFRMVDVSPSYETTFLREFNIPTAEYVGFTDFDVWPKAIAEEFYKEDKKVARTGNPEYVTGTDPRGGELFIVKERVIIGNVIYVDGMAFKKKAGHGWCD